MKHLLFIGFCFSCLLAASQVPAPRYIGAVVYPYQANCSNKLAAGGFSGITFNNDTFYIVSDAKPEQGGARIYKYFVPYSQTAVQQPIPLDTVYLPADFAIGDCEALCYRNGALFIGNEVDPGQYFYVTELGLNNAVKKDIAYPEPFVAGIHNLKWNGMEGMTLSPDGNIWFVNENPLQFAPDVNKGYLRVGCMNQNGKLLAQYFYAPQAGYRVSDILAIDNANFLVMEVKFDRSAPRTHRVSVHINKVAATGINEVPNETYARLDTLPKTLMLDLNGDSILQQYIQAADGGQAAIDNFEGMCWGRVLPNGRRTLVLVTDDNFGCYNGVPNRQNTELVIYEWP